MGGAAMREKGEIVSQPHPAVKPDCVLSTGFMEKKAQLRGVALNPPKEEGGGDKLEHRSIFADLLWCLSLNSLWQRVLCNARNIDASRHKYFYAEIIGCN
jgi:hypothetical protein